MKAHGKQWKWVWDCSTRQGCWLPDAAPTFAASHMGQYGACAGKDKRSQPEQQQQQRQIPLRPLEQVQALQLPLIAATATEASGQGGYAAAAAPSARDERAASERALKIRMETARRLKERDAIKEIEKMEQERRFQQALEQRRAKLRVIEKNITAGPRVKVDEIVGGKRDIQIAPAQRRAEPDSAANTLDKEIAAALARADAVAGSSAQHSSRRFSANHTRREAAPIMVAPPVVGYKKRVEQLRIQVDALRRVEAEEGDVDAVSRQELAHDLVQQQRNAVTAGLRKVQAWRVEAAVAAAAPQFARADLLESLDLDVEPPKPAAAACKPAPLPPPAPAGYASRRPAPTPLIPTANHRKLMGTNIASAGGSGIIVPGPAARVLMGSASTFADDDAVDIAPPPRLQAASASTLLQPNQHHHQQHQQQHQQHPQHAHQQQQQTPSVPFSLPPVKTRSFRAASPLLEVEEEEDLLSPMFDSLDLDVKARQVNILTIPPLQRAHCVSVRCVCFSIVLLRCVLSSVVLMRAFSLLISPLVKKQAKDSTTGPVSQCEPACPLHEPPIAPCISPPLAGACAMLRRLRAELSPAI
jgi:hypothetical protein